MVAKISSTDQNIDWKSLNIPTFPMLASYFKGLIEYLYWYLSCIYHVSYYVLVHMNGFRRKNGRILLSIRISQMRIIVSI